MAPDLNQGTSIVGHVLVFLHFHLFPYFQFDGQNTGISSVLICIFSYQLTSFIQELQSREFNP